MTSSTRTTPPTWPDTLLFVGAAAALTLGWLNRYDTWIEAEEGLGYALGIIGGSLMLALIIYPLRKKFRWMSRLGSVTGWFRTHMWFGVLGPVAILFHANFQLGSLNSNVALFAMTTVALSGLIGRFFYSKVHHSLYTSRLSLGELRTDLGDSRKDLGEMLSRAPRLDRALRTIEDRALRMTSGIISAWWRTVRVRMRGWWISMLLPWSLLGLRANRKERREAKVFVRAHLKTIYRIADFALYTRLLGMWHLLHLPLFILMVIAGCVHVVAVHLY